MSEKIRALAEAARALRDKVMMHEDACRQYDGGACDCDLPLYAALRSAIAGFDQKPAINWVVTIRETRLLPAIHWAAQHAGGRERCGFAHTFEAAVRDAGQATKEAA